MSKTNPPTSARNDEHYVQELAWKLLDDHLDEEEAEQLDLLLTHSEAARQTYMQIVSLHVDLLDHFGALPGGEEMLKKALAAPPADANSPPGLPTAEVPTTEPTGA